MGQKTSYGQIGLYTSQLHTYITGIYKRELSFMPIKPSNILQKTLTHSQLLGYPRHKTSTGVDIFFSLIFSYFCFFVAAFRPCHGRLPRLKYISTYPKLSKSSLLLCSKQNDELALIRITGYESTNNVIGT